MNDFLLSTPIAPGTTPWTTPTTDVPATTARSRVIGRMSARSDGDWESLNDTAVALMSRRILALVDGKVTADEVSTHGGLFSGQCFRLADSVRLIFAMVDSHRTAVPGRCLIELVSRVGPLTSTAET